VYWTKFECISDKIRRILKTNRTRRARGGSKLPRTLRLRGECASDTLVDSRVQKPKNFLAFSSRLLPPHPSTAKRKKKWKGNFWFCFAVSVSEKNTISLSLLIALFSALTATEALPYLCLAVTLTSANTHNRLRIARSHSLALAASALCAFAWWLRSSLW
jgi:hypothetical protein